MKKDSAQCDKAKFYGMTLLSFHTGAALSLILYMTCGLSGVWLCLVPAFYAVWLISADRNTVAIHRQLPEAQLLTAAASGIFPIRKKRPDFILALIK